MKSSNKEVRMKKSVFAVIILVIAMTGCGRKGISEDEFNFVWSEFVKKEFSQNLTEKQSSDGKLKIIQQIARENKIDYNQFNKYLKEKHADKYNSLFQMNEGNKK